MADEIKIGWISDIHYSDEISRFVAVLNESRYYANAGQRVLDALNDFARYNADFAVMGGDLVDENAANYDTESTKYINDVGNSDFTNDIFHIGGNHDINQLRDTDSGTVSALHTVVFDKLSSVQASGTSGQGWPSPTNACAYYKDVTIGATTFRLIFLAWADTTRNGIDFDIGAFRSTVRLNALTVIPTAGTSVLTGGTGGMVLSNTGGTTMTNTVTGELETHSSNDALVGAETLDDDQNAMDPDPATIQDFTQVLTFTNAITTPPNVGDVLLGSTSGSTLIVTAVSTPDVTGQLRGWFQVGEEITNSTAAGRWVPTANPIASLSAVTGNNDPQMVWLAETALNTTDPCLIFAHSHFTTASNASYAYNHNATIIGGIRAILANKQAADGNIVGVFTGQYHRGAETQIIDNVAYHHFKGGALANSLSDTGSNAYYLIYANSSGVTQIIGYARQTRRNRYRGLVFSAPFSRTRGGH